MTLPSSGTLSLNAINTEFALGTNLQVYQGVRWYLNNAGTGTFSSGTIKISDFYSKRKTSPVTPGNTTISTVGTTSYTVPLYSTLTVTIYGGSGGGGGGNGTASGGSNGTNGGASSFGSYGTGDYGRGGTPTTPGTDGTGFTNTDPNDPVGGTGGGAPGGGGGKTVIVLTNPINGGNGPAVGGTVSVVVGAAGVGGSGGTSLVYNPVTHSYIPTNAASGGNGNPGLVTIAWA